ncbi:hypothetical protein AB0M54_47810 [Actinoplanes sp. NPDC051470]|uniref:hypothetical protein n=1 Tax=Actinoplanes sp. NPDC051470 TaxID=3157224 RepID=UPI003416FA3E
MGVVLVVPGSSTASCEVQFLRSLLPVRSDDANPLIRATTDAPSLAVALGNALAFLPARSLIPYVAIRVNASGVFTCGTDSYAAGTDVAPVTGYIGDATEVVALVDKEGLTALEKAAREAKKVTATIEIKDGLVTVSPMGMQPGSAVNHQEGADRFTELHSAVWEIIDAAERRKNVLPPGVMLDPTLFGRFSKVKADKSERKADLLFAEGHEPVLIKIGPTFKGLIMPVDREVNSRELGQDGLW